MSVHCLSSICPIIYNNQTCFTGSSSKSRMKNVSTYLLHHNSAYVRCIGLIPCGISKVISLGKPCKFASSLLVTKAVKANNPKVASLGEEESTYDFDWGDEEDEGSPWEEAIIYRRNSSISHIEYCTTLERLGLGKLSTELSRSRASTMGLRVTKAVTDYVNGTPVLVSVDVTRKKHKLRIDGIIRTVITLGCNRCGEPAAESVYSNFSLLLTEEREEEPDIISLGTVYGETTSQTTAGTGQDKEDDDALIDIEDRLYFPPEDKEIDISKQIRDLIHLEITINSICDAKCKGLCLQCGSNLNTSICKCGGQEIVDMGVGPLGDLKRRMQCK